MLVQVWERKQWVLGYRKQDPHSTRMRSIYFASRVMNALENGYTKVEQMMLALIFVVRNLDPIFYQNLL